MEAQQPDTGMILNAVPNGITAQQSVGNYLAELPGKRAKSEQEQAAAQLAQRQVAGQQALQAASVESSKVNPDGTVTVDYPSLATGLARRGFGDIAQAITKNHLDILKAGIANAKSQTEANKAQNDYELGAKQHFAAGISAIPEAQRPQAILGGIQHFKNDLGVDIPLESFANKDGQYDPAKVDAFLKSSRAASMTAPEAATVKQTEATTGLTNVQADVANRAQNVNEITNVVGGALKDPSSVQSEQARAQAARSGIPNSELAGLSAQDIAQNKGIQDRITAFNSQAPLSSTIKEGGVVDTVAERTKQQNIVQAQAALKNLSKKGLPLKAGTIAINKLKEWTNDPDYITAKNALETLNQENGTKLSLDNGATALIGALGNQWQKSEERRKAAAKVSNSSTAGEAANAIPTVEQPADIVEPTEVVKKPTWAN